MPSKRRALAIVSNLFMNRPPLVSRAGTLPAGIIVYKHDGHHFEEVLDVNNTGKEVNADKAYPSAQRLAMLKTLGFKEGIQRKAQKNKPLSACQQRRNHRIAKRRAKVEHVFAGIRHMGGKFLRTIGQARASATMVLMAACYNLKRLASFLERGVDSFYKSKPSKTQVRVQAAN